MNVAKHAMIAEEARILARKAREVANELRELQEECPDLSGITVYDGGRTNLDAILWPGSNIGIAGLRSTGGFRSTGAPRLVAGVWVSGSAQIRSRLLQIQEQLPKLQKRSQAECSHLDGWKRVTPDESWCGVCLKNWDEVEQEKG